MKIKTTIASALLWFALCLITACSGSDTPPETTTPAPPPTIVANAKPDQSVFIGTFVTLNGSKSMNANGTGLTYAWTMNKPAGSKATLSNPAAVNPTFTADVGGTYEATLVVTGDQQNSAPATVMVTASGTNPPPVANAGPKQNVFVNTPVVLNGKQSTDANDDPLTFTWRLSGVPKGSTSTLFDRNTVAPSFTPDRDGTYIAELVVSDGTSSSTPSTVTIAASKKPSPTASAGKTPTLYFHLNTSSVTLNGSDSHTTPPGGELEYTWTFNSPSPAPALIDADKAIARFSPPSNVAAIYVAQLKVTEKNHPGPESGTDLDTVSVTIGPLASVQAFLPSNLTSPILTCTVKQCGMAAVPVGTSIQLDGGASQVTDLTYLWSITNPSAGATLINQTKVKAIFTPKTGSSEGIAYTLRLKVTDPGGNTDTRSFTILAKTGPIFSIKSEPSNPGVPETITVSLSSESTSSTLTYLWELIARPDNSKADFDPETIKKTSATFTTDKDGDYTVKLTITDTSTTPNTMTPATLKITANSPPTAVIKALSTVNVCDIVSIDGADSNDTGSGIKAYAWSLVKPGDSGTSLSNTSGSTSSFKADKAGSYTVTLKVTDSLMVESTEAKKEITTGLSATGKVIFKDAGLPGDSTKLGNPPCMNCHKAGTFGGGATPGTDISGRSELALTTAVTTVRTTLGSMGTTSLTNSALTDAIHALKVFLDSTSSACP